MAALRYELNLIKTFLGENPNEGLDLSGYDSGEGNVYCLIQRETAMEGGYREISAWLSGKELMAYLKGYLAALGKCEKLDPLTSPRAAEIEVMQAEKERVASLALGRMTTITQMAREIVQIRQAARQLFIFIEDHAPRSFLAHGKALSGFRMRLLLTTSHIDLDDEVKSRVFLAIADLKKEGAS